VLQFVAVCFGCTRYALQCVFGILGMTCVAVCFWCTRYVLQCLLGTPRVCCTVFVAYGVATISRMLKNICLFCRALLQKRPIFLSILLIVATPY